MTCPFLKDDNECSVNKTSCNEFNVYIYCETHYKNNPLDKKRKSIILKKLMSVGKNLGMVLTIRYLIIDNTARIYIYNKENIILAITDDISLVPFEMVNVIKNKIGLQDKAVIKTEIELTESELIRKALKESKPLSEVLKCKVYDKETIEIQLLNSSKSENTAVVSKNGVLGLYFVNVEISFFIEHFSVSLFLEKSELVRLL